MNATIIAVPLAVHGHGFVPFSFCFLLRDAAGGLHVIDPGWADESNWRILVDALDDASSDASGAQAGGLSSVRTIIVTHLHPDHLGLAERLAARTGATVMMHDAELVGLSEFARGDSTTDQLRRWGVPPGMLHAPDARVLRGIPVGDPPRFDSLVHVGDGDLLPIDGWELQVIHTPGHTAGHICLTDRRAAVTFTGDHVLPHMYPGIGLGGTTASSPVADYLDSLHKVADLDGEVLPGHGYRFTGMRERCIQIEDRVRRRIAEVAQAMSDDAGTTWEIAGRMTWTGGFAALEGYRLESALEQVALYSDFVRRSSSAWSGGA